MNMHYAGGIFDGEGYVYIFKKVKGYEVGYYISTGLTMAHYPTVLSFHQAFGGHLNGNRADLRNPKHRTQFMWGAANQKAATFLRKIRPYLKIKGEEVDIALALQAHIDERDETIPRDERLAYRDSLFKKCKELKSTTFPPLLRKSPVVNGQSKFGRPKNR